MINIAVDGSCLKNPGIIEYRGIDIDTGIELFREKYNYGTNNIAEYLAIVHAIIYCRVNNLEGSTIYSDSVTALAWVRDKRCNTKLVGDTDDIKNIKQILDKVEGILKRNTTKVSIRKWDTRNKGENPADFGRK